MFERDAEQFKKQASPRYAIAGVCGLLGIGLGFAIGGWIGLAVGLGCAAVGSTVFYAMQLGQAGSNLVHNEVRRPLFGKFPEKQPEQERFQNVSEGRASTQTRRFSDVIQQQREEASRTPERY